MYKSPCPKSAEFRPSQVDFAWGDDSASASSPPTAATATIPIDFSSFSDPPISSIITPYGSLNFPIQYELDPLHVPYLAAQIDSFISTFASQSYTPFIHPLTYSNRDDLPTLYTDALSVCALRTVKSPLTFDILDVKMSTLVTASVKDYWRPQDWLLAVQVLIPYQIIRMWEGDDRQRQTAYRHMPVLLSWTSTLCEEYASLLAQGMGLRRISFQKAATEDCYRRWIFMESMRRTIMMSTFMQCLGQYYRVGSVGPHLPMLMHLPVSTGAGRVWERIRTTKTEELGDTCFLEDELDLGGIFGYEEWVDGWNLGVVKAGDCDEDVYERLLLLACSKAAGVDGTEWATKLFLGMGVTDAMNAGS
ncbi:ras small monomeric protein [Rutstroemia sp. NJR-2017a WRK4]|nr:ras small monomeric protein [Rutstroemia sp. NJR-2017a WRK4]